MIDVATGTIYVTTFGKPNASEPEHRAQQHALDPRRQHAGRQAAAGADRRQCRQRRRRDRERLHHAVSEDARRPGPADRCRAATRRSSSRSRSTARIRDGPGHGFVVAYDVRGLNREAGFTPTPAVWNVTPGGGAGGIWMSGSGPAIEGSDIYLATGNGMDPGTMPGNFGESFVKLRYTPGVAGVNNGKPKLEVADFWGAFSDFGRADDDQDLGAAGVVHHSRARQSDRRRQGRHPLQPEQGQSREEHLGSAVQPAVRRHLSAQSAERRRRSSDDDRRQSELADRQSRSQPAGADADAEESSHPRHAGVHGARDDRDHLSVGRERAAQGLQLQFRARKRITGFRGEGTQFASGNMAAPGGMPGGRLVVSSNGTTPNTGVVWGVYPTQGNANSAVVHGALVAYDATTVTNGKMKQLFHSDAKPANNMGNFAKYATPVVANGKVYVATFSNKVVQYGL